MVGSVSWAAPLLAGILIGCAGIALVVWLALRPKRKPRSRVPLGTRSIEMACHICQRELAFTKNDMVLLSGPEMALAVRAAPGMVGRTLAEYVCPHCEAAHCFIVDAHEPVWIGTNLYEPQSMGARCFECRKPLKKPPWAVGAYDGRLREAPQLLPDYGLVCPRCWAVCCVACCKKATRNRAKGDALVCPRCFRHPVDKVFHH